MTVHVRRNLQYCASAYKRTHYLQIFNSFHEAVFFNYGFFILFHPKLEGPYKKIVDISNVYAII